MLVKYIGKSAVGILNFVTPNSRSHEETARVVLEAIPLLMAPVVLHRYDAHRLANIRGLTAQELEPDNVAAHEISRARPYHTTGGKQNACLPILARNRLWRFI